MPRSSVFFRNLNGKAVPIETIRETFVQQDWSLPLPLLLAFAATMTREQYCDVSVTQLCGDHQPSILRLRHDVVVDPESLLWTAMGTGLHRALADAGGDGSEVRLVHEIGGLKVGGTIDYCPSENEIIDWKTTSVYKAKKCLAGTVEKEAPDWWEQLQHYATLARLAKGWKINKLTLILLPRDWRPSEAEYKRDYPKQIVATSFAVLADAVGQEFLSNRVNRWKENIEKDDAKLERCDDLWGTTSGGEPKRCTLYCQVKESCHQYASIMASK